MTAPIQTYTLKEVSQLLRCTVRTVQNLISRGQLRPIYIGNRPRIRENELSRFLDRATRR